MQDKKPNQISFHGGFAQSVNDVPLNSLHAPFCVADLFFSVLSFLPFTDMRSLTQVNSALLSQRKKVADHSIGEEILKRIALVKIIPHWLNIDYVECLEYLTYPNQQYYFQELENQFYWIRHGKCELSEDGEKIIFSIPNRQIIFSTHDGKLLGISEKQEEDMLGYLTTASYSPLLHESDTKSASYSSQCEDYLTIKDQQTAQIIHQSQIPNVCSFILFNHFIFLIEYERTSQIKLRLQKYAIPTSMFMIAQPKCLPHSSQKEMPTRTAHRKRRRDNSDSDEQTALNPN